MYQLGSGGFGKTYEISDRAQPSAKGDRNSVPKVLKILTSNHPKHVELFQREARVLARLQHHGIPKVEPNAYFLFLAKNRSEPLHCLVMEKIEGLNLQQYIKKRGSAIDQKLAIQWLAQLVTILQEVHNQNFFHRDIKPSNIMLGIHGQLVLIDFGTVREVTESLVLKQSFGQVTGIVSAGYTPPEQFNGQAVPQSDFFALGRTFVYLLTGQDPSVFYDTHTDELRWRDAVRGISPQLADLLDRLMARSPNQRPQKAEEIQQWLTEINNAWNATGGLSQLTSPANLTETESTLYVPSSGSFTQQVGNATEQKSSLKVPSSDPTLQAASTTPLPTKSQLEPNFINRCQQELAEIVGPIASIICQRTLSKNPNLSSTELIEALAKQIPNSTQAVEFKQRLLS
jgi:eukaryotic-like serine/threonine-protein kinase